MTDEELRERLVERRTVFEGGYLSVHVDRVATADGEATREVVGHPGAVAIVATDGEGRILLVRQWRHAAGRALWEIPAGTRETGEAPEATARRELGEETGYDAKVWESLGAAFMAPGYSSELIHFFAARQLTEGDAHTDAGENVVARLFSPAEVGELVAAAEVDVKTVAALALAGFTVRARS